MIWWVVWVCAWAPPVVTIVGVPLDCCWMMICWPVVLLLATAVALLLTMVGLVVITFVF